MCDANMMMGQQIAGAASGAIGSYYTAKTQKIAGNAAADIAEINAKIMESTAQSELYAGQREEQKVLLNKAQIKSSQRASIAANGIDLGSETAVNILNSTDVMGEIDANTVAANASRNAWGYRLQGVNFSNDAIAKRAGAKGISPFQSVADSLLTSASKIGTTRYALQKVGALPKDDWWARNVESLF